MRVWLNGKIVDSKHAKISIFDRGFLYGDGVFETMRSYNGAVFRMEDHLERLRRALRLLRIEMAPTRTELAGIICRLLRMNNLKDAYIRVSVSRGEEGFGIDASDLAAPTVSIVTRRLMPYPAWMYEKGIRVMAVSLRLNERSPVSRVKSFNFLNNILARFEAKGRGFDEAILMNTRGCIAEAATSNVFLVRKGMIATPSLETGMLPGVTRRVVLKIARDLRLRPVEKAISYSELVRAGEVFLTNSLFEIMPVIKIDTHTINDGRVGATTRLLGACYRKLTCERAAARGA